MSALARMMLKEGKEVLGSDLSDSEITHFLREKGVSIDIGQDSSFIPEDVDLVIRTIAVDEYDQGLIQALEDRGIHSLTYPEMLGVVSRNKYTVAISGTHGKTTTTAMTAQVISDKSPTVIVGSLVDFQGERTNFIPGTSDIFLVEACEYRRSFLNVNPNILVITNIEEDHLDYYKDLEDIQNAFRTLAEKVPEDGYIICDPHDPNVAPVIGGVKATIVDYTSLQDEFSLLVPGEHNKKNARAAYRVAELFDVEKENIISFLESFKGTWRRAEYRGETEKKAVVYDDYAHHPTEIQTTLAGFKEKFPQKNIMVAFQPHLFSRTKLFLDELSGSFSDADKVVILPIYAAREEVDPTISSEMLAEHIAERGVSVVYKKSFDEAATYLEQESDSNSLILTMGAGDVYAIVKMLCE